MEMFTLSVHVKWPYKGPSHLKSHHLEVGTWPVSAYLPWVAGFQLHGSEESHLPKVIVS